jgi:REP element-mobilizing transposase RayT
MTRPSHELDANQRRLVLEAIIEVCRHSGWTLLAAHVRMTHVHVVVTAEVLPERIMNALKSYTSRRLNGRRLWARHGSTVYLWTSDAVSKAVAYVVEKQGATMAVYVPSLTVGAR